MLLCCTEMTFGLCLFDVRGSLPLVAGHLRSCSCNAISLSAIHRSATYKRTNRSSVTDTEDAAFAKRAASSDSPMVCEGFELQTAEMRLTRLLRPLRDQSEVHMKAWADRESCGYAFSRPGSFW